MWGDIKSVGDFIKYGGLEHDQIHSQARWQVGEV